MTEHSSQAATTIPADDPARNFTLVQSDNPNLPHIGLVGDTFHDFEEMFSVLGGEIEVTFRGKKTVIRAGETINIPANAPHQFQNKSNQPARLLCLCSPAGQEEFFKEVGVPVATAGREQCSLRAWVRACRRHCRLCGRVSLLLSLNSASRALLLSRQLRQLRYVGRRRHGTQGFVFTRARHLKTKTSKDEELRRSQYNSSVLASSDQLFQ
jgi:hypothetical protein